MSLSKAAVQGRFVVRRRKGLMVLLALWAIVSALLVAPVLKPPRPAGPAAGVVPARPTANTFAAFSDQSLWNQIVATGRMAVVGLKNPGQARGVWRQRILLTPGQWRTARETVLDQSGVTLVRADTALPLLTVRLSGPGAVRDLRRMPNVDYLEPLSLAPRVEGSGCVGSWPLGGGPYWQYGSPTPHDTYGNLLPWNFQKHNIPQAWSLADGRGVTVGVVDTGVYQGQTLLQRSGFNGGLSTGRSVTNLMSLPYMGDPWDRCGHGTRVAGTIAAPRNGGTNIVGVAWNANLVTARVMDGVDINNHSAALSVADGIERAWTYGARIINLSIGWLTSYQAVEDEIRLHADTTLFVGAAGSNICLGPTVLGVPTPVPAPVLTALLPEHRGRAVGRALW